VAFCSNRVICLAIAIILIGDWAAFALYPVPPGFDYTTVGLPKNWPHLLSGFYSHWNKNSNLGWAFDTWFLNLFPRPEPFRYNEFGSTTLNFVPTLAVMLFGLLAGRRLREETSSQAKAKWLVVLGLILLFAGWACGAIGICPVVKRIWTPSWSLYSTGWCFLLLAVFYALIEIWRIRKWAFPLIVIGMNSVAAYCVVYLFEQFIYKNLVIHFGSRLFQLLGAPLEPFLHGLAVLLVFWLLLFWLYRRRIFLRV
jgi:heparan-alpha-glucosaminide N-acetyltransferase